MRPHLTLTVDEVRSALDYDPTTGIFVWRDGRKRPGAIAGTAHKSGYLVISVNNVLFLAHRLAWAHRTGEWPLLCVDHINRDRLDNRFSNLREASYRQNAANSCARGASGVKGVYLRASGNWNATIRDGDKLRSLGTFRHRVDAERAYRAAAVILHGEFARFS